MTVSSYNNVYNKARTEAFHVNIDLNSLIEGVIFKNKMNTISSKVKTALSYSIEYKRPEVEAYLKSLIKQ